MPTLTSISPLAGPPGTTVTCVGSGFDSASQVGCPTLVATTYVDAGTLTAVIPDMAGPAGGTMAIGVFVWNSDGTASGVQMFTVQFPAVTLQTWTSIDQVCGEVPGFLRGGKISDGQIQTWIESIAQVVAGVMLKRGLSLDPTVWQQPGTNAWPTPSGVLEMMVRLGAASRLAAAIASNFGGGDWPVRKNLDAAYQDEIMTLREGEYDKLFNPAAATVDPGPLLAAETGCWPAFRKETKF